MDFATPQQVKVAGVTVVETHWIPLQDGRRLALNDDATEDLTLGNNAQLFRIQLPRDERYILKAGRYEGSGRYELVIVPNT